MLGTRLTQFKPIVEILAIELNAAIPANARDRALGDQVAKRGCTPSQVLCGRGNVEETAIISLERRGQPLVNTVSDGPASSCFTAAIIFSSLCFVFFI